MGTLLYYIYSTFGTGLTPGNRRRAVGGRRHAGGGQQQHNGPHPPLAGHGAGGASGESVEQHWRQQVDAATARVAARHMSRQTTADSGYHPASRGGGREDVSPTGG